MHTRKITKVRTLQTASDGGLYQGALCKLIESSRMFSDFSRQEIESIARYASVRDVEAGETVFNEGEKGRNFYLVVKGEIKILKDSGGEIKSLTTVKQGHTMGEMSIFDNLPYSASAVAEKEARLVSISHSSFQQLSGSQCQLALKIVKQIARLMSLRLRHTTGTLVDSE